MATFEQIQEKAIEKNIGVFFRKSAPDARPSRHLYRYFAYDSATANGICGFKTLKEMEAYVDDRIEYLYPTDVVGTKTFEELQHIVEDLKLGIYIRRNAPDTSECWEGYNYYTYESGTTNGCCGFKTLKELEECVEEWQRDYEEKKEDEE